jgi:RNA polymerase sigma-70 factor (ECF subfamily)
VSEQVNDWLARARKGDDEAFALLVETYQKPVYNLCYRMLGDAQEAEDAAQECFWRAYRALHRYDPQRSFITWLLSIAAHYCIDQQRRRRLPIYSIDLISEEIVPDNAPSPETSATQSEQDRMLHQLMSAMKPLDRAALVLRYWYDLSDQEISQVLSTSVSAVKSRLHRARLSLAENWRITQSEMFNEEIEKYETPAL